MMLAVEAALARGVKIDTSGGSACKAHCVRLTGALKKQCERDCDAIEAAAIVAEHIRRDLVISFHDVIWGGGNIDPLPDPLILERAVRDRFAATGKMPRG
jgi:hypothetical protein